MRRHNIIIVVVVLAVLGNAEAALAWGPAIHIALGGSLLNELGLVPAGVAAIIFGNRAAFLFGNIAADVVFAKRLSRVKQSCHHWSTGFRLLQTAGDPQAKAFAYGYLSHLAADTVAHGKFVPHQVMQSGMTINAGHLYWEVRADATASQEVWRELAQLLDQDHACHHRSLARQINDTFLSYRLNRLLFDGITALAANRSVRRTVDIWHRCSCWYLSPELVAGYQLECVDRIVAVLRDGPKSRVTRDDPNGTSALMSLSVQRRDHRRFRRRGLPIDGRLREAKRSLVPASLSAGKHPGESTWCGSRLVG